MAKLVVYDDFREDALSSRVGGRGESSLRETRAVRAGFLTCRIAPTQPIRCYRTLAFGLLP